MAKYIVPILMFAVVAAACSGSGADTTTTVGDTVAAPTTTAPSTTAPAPTSTDPSTTTPAPTTEPRAPRTTSTTTSTTTTTTLPRTTVTTNAVQAGGAGARPAVKITGPGNLTRYVATYSEADQSFGANVSFSASVSDADGDLVSVEWFSSDEGFLGSGASISTRLRTVGSDSSQPVITVRATDAQGNVTEQTIQVIVFIESDQ